MTHFIGLDVHLLQIQFNYWNETNTVYSQNNNHPSLISLNIQRIKILSQGDLFYTKALDINEKHILCTLNVLTTVNMKSSVSWDMKLSVLVDHYHCFGGIAVSLFGI
jgi:hypothetical protein